MRIYYRPPCSVEGCIQPHSAHGYCQTHWRRLLRSGTTDQLPYKRRARQFEVCTVDGCEREHAARGFCDMHFKRWQRNGEPGVKGHVYRTDISDEDRIFARLVLDGDCWISSQTINPRNYGKVSINGKVSLLHRWMYEYLIGPIPEGLELDHLCRNRPCGNPYHLDPVTHQVNIARAKTQDGPRDDTVHRGEANGSSKLTAKDVRWAREQVASGVSFRVVAKTLGVSRPTIGNIITGKNWVGIGLPTTSIATSSIERETTS